MKINHPEQVFVSDITYIKTDEGLAYLALVTDVYSKNIMGWSFDNNMKVSMVKEALKMAQTTVSIITKASFTTVIEVCNIAVRIIPGLPARKAL